MQAASIATTTAMRADDGSNRNVLRHSALAALLGTAGVALCDTLSRAYGLGLNLSSDATLAAVATGAAAVWVGSLWHDVRRAAESIAQRSAPETSPKRRNLHGTTQAGRFPVARAALKFIAAGIRTPIAEYAGRRGEDKVMFLRRAETWYRAASIALVAAASILVLRTLLA